MVGSESLNINIVAQIIIYTTPSCIYCQMAKSYFAENGIQYTEKNVMEDMTAQADMIQKSGQMGVPVIDINGTIVLGFDKPKIRSLLGL